MKNLKKLPTYIIYSALFGIFVATPVSASESITTNVSVEPSLTLSLSASSLALNLDPSITTFGYKDLDVIVGTNNATGYKLTMSTTSGDTNLVNTEDNTKVIETLPTLAGGYTDSTFIVNKWGYKKNRNTDNYNSFPATQTLLENDERTNQDIANLRFGTKIDYLQESGTYATNIEFNLVANPLCTSVIEGTMQGFIPCPDIADGTTGTLTDIRDSQEYTIAKINGNFWMTRNLAIGCNGTGSTYGSSYSIKTITNADSDVVVDYTTSTTSLSTGDSWNPQQTCSSSYGAWYNYASATAGTIIANSDSNEAEYSLCPKGWRLPTYTEENGILNNSSFMAVKGGAYANGGQYLWSQYGYYWTSTAYNNVNRYYGVAGNTSAAYLTHINNHSRYSIGVYIRCILK